jgi:hypothetical protein
MASLGTQLATILAVFVGAAASFAFSQLAERFRWKRESSERWDEKALDVYIDYVNSTGRFEILATRMIAARGLDTHGSAPVDLTVGADDLARAESDLTERWASLLLLAPTDVISAAQRWRHAIWHIEWFARGLLNDETEYAIAAEEVDAARDSFIDAARSDLRLTKGPLPAIVFPPEWQERTPPDPQI